MYGLRNNIYSTGKSDDYYTLFVKPYQKVVEESPVMIHVL